MRYRANHKDEARATMLEAIGRGFRRQGYGGIGVDGLAKDAGVTSGAFYGHFKSKEAAFAAAAVGGLDDLRKSIADLQAEQGEYWAECFIDFYLGERLHCVLDTSCGLQSLTPDVVRAGEETKALYEAGLTDVARQLAKRLKGKTEDERLQRAWSLMALLSGGVTMARSIASPEVREVVATQLKHAARGLL